MENVISNSSLKENNLFKDSLITKVQKIIWWVMLLVFALLCVYALVMSTIVSNLMFYDEDLLTNVKPYNDIIILLGIFGILFAFGYKITRSNIRGKYYISNFVYMTIQSLYTLVAGVVSLIAVIKYQSFYNGLDFTDINETFELTKPGTTMNASDGTGMFIFGYILSGIIILVTLLSVYVLVGKFLKEENANKIVENAEDTASTDADLAK